MVAEEGEEVEALSSCMSIQTEETAAAAEAAGAAGAAGTEAGAYTRSLFSSTRALFVPYGGVLCWFQ
jgi:hypothetical protein